MVLFVITINPSVVSYTYGSAILCVLKSSVQTKFNFNKQELISCVLIFVILTSALTIYKINIVVHLHNYIRSLFLIQFDLVQSLLS